VPEADQCQYKFPVNGVSFDEAVQLLHNLTWLLAAPLILNTQFNPHQTAIQKRTYILVALDALLLALRTTRTHANTLQKVWDKDADSKNRFTFRMMRNIDLIFSCFRLLIRPFEKPAIFFAAHPDSNPGLTEYVLRSYYSQHSCPDFLSPSEEHPHLAQAIGTLYSQFKGGWSSYLTQGSADLDSPPEDMIARAPASRKHSNEGQSDPAKSKKPRATDDPGKKLPLRQSSTPFLRWVDDFPADKRNAAGIAAVLSAHRDSIPRVHNPGSVKPYRDNSPLCFPFIIEGMGCYLLEFLKVYSRVTSFMSCHNGLDRAKRILPHISP
jgi:hypothetical protein